MSHFRLSLVIWGLVLGRDEQAEVDLGKLGEVAFLRRYIGSADERLAPKELGRSIDHGLVEYIEMHLSLLKLGDIGIEEFKSRMRQIEEGIRENMALKPESTDAERPWG